MGNILLGEQILTYSSDFRTDFLTEVLREQFATLPDYTEDLSGKTIVIVGANVGLGYEGSWQSFRKEWMSFDYYPSGEEIC